MTVLQIDLNMLYQQAQCAALLLVRLWFVHKRPQEVWTNFMDLAAFVFWCVLKLHEEKRRLRLIL